MPLLNKEQLKAAGRSLKTVDVEVPEWGGSVRLQALSAARQIELVGDLGADEAQSMSPRRAFDYSTRLLALSVVDENGEPVFSQVELGEKSSDVLGRLAQEAMKLNGIGVTAVEEIRESLGPAPSVDSGSN